MLALSNPKILSDGKAMHPGRPRVYTIAENPRPGNQMGLLFVALHYGLSAERTAGCRLLFYGVTGKMLVNMRLNGRGGRMARFGVNHGGTWEMHCDTTYRMVNGLAMLAQLVFWRHAVADDGGDEAGYYPAAARDGITI